MTGSGADAVAANRHCETKETPDQERGIGRLGDNGEVVDANPCHFISIRTGCDDQIIIARSEIDRDTLIFPGIQRGERETNPLTLPQSGTV